MKHVRITLSILFMLLYMIGYAKDIEKLMLDSYDQRNKPQLKDLVENFEKNYKRKDRVIKVCYYKSLYFNLMKNDDSTFYNLNKANKLLRFYNVDYELKKKIVHDYAIFTYVNGFYSATIMLCEDFIKKNKLSLEDKYLFMNIIASSLIEEKRFDESYSMFKKMEDLVMNNESLKHLELNLRNDIANLEFYRGDYKKCKELYLAILDNFKEDLKLKHNRYAYSYALEFLADSKISLNEADSKELMLQAIDVAYELNDSKRISNAHYVELKYYLTFHPQEYLANQEKVNFIFDKISDLEMKSIAIEDLTSFGYAFVDELRALEFSHMSFVTGKVRKFLLMDFSTNSDMDEQIGSLQYVLKNAILFIGVLLLATGTIAFVMKRLHNRYTKLRVKYSLLKFEIKHTTKEVFRAVSRDLHDAVLGKLYVLKLKLFTAQESQQLAFAGDAPVLLETVKNIEDELRFITKEYKSDAHLGMPLKNRILQEVKSNLAGIAQLNFRIEDLDQLPQNNTKVTRNLLRIVQEATSNITRHANATKVEIQFTAQGDQGILKISDNGIGISNNQVGQGMGNLRKRTEEINGDLAVVSNSETGTEIKVVFNW